VRVLVACEWSGVVREAFRKRGHDAWSCDLLDSGDNSQWHIKADALSILGDGWDMMIAFPPCTYLCSSGLHWNTRRPERSALTEVALSFVQALMDAPIPRICIENPRGCIGTRIRKADQAVQPWQFGDNASKETCLWLKGLPLLDNTNRTQWVPGRIVGEDLRGRTIVRWANQTDSGQNKLGPSDTRAAERGKTYQGIAAAMAKQWGAL